jgi:hypothetical protein
LTTVEVTTQRAYNNILNAVSNQRYNIFVQTTLLVASNFQYVLEKAKHFYKTFFPFVIRIFSKTHSINYEKREIHRHKDLFLKFFLFIQIEMALIFGKSTKSKKKKTNKQNIRKIKSIRHLT